MSLPWFRLYSEFSTDPKIQLLAFEDQRHFIILLCLKCNGTLDTNAVSKEHFDRLICKALGLDLTSGSEAKRRLIDVGIIDQNWQPVNWDSRQFKSDNSTARVHKFRGKTQRNVSETLQKRPSNGIEQIQNRYRTDKIQNTTAHKTAPIEFEDLKKSYPKRSGDQGWQKALKACSARLKDGATWDEMLDGARRYSRYCSVTGKIGTEFVKQACTFFGPDKHYLNPWEPPPNKGEVVRNANVDISLQWLEQQEKQNATV